MSTTPNLALEQWPSGTPSGSVPVNDALQVIDALLHLSVEDKDLTAPPTTVAGDVGKSWIVGASATGAWAGKDGQVALCTAADTWRFMEPKEGWRADVRDEDIAYRYSGSAWGAIGDASAAAVTIADAGGYFTSTNVEGALQELGAGGGGGGSSFTAPPQTGWSWVNQGGATLTDSASYQKIEGGASGVGASIRGRFRALPAAPYTVTAALQCTRVSKSFVSAGIALRNSGSGSLVVLADLSTTPSAASNDRTLQLAKFNSPTSFNADYRALGFHPSDTIWLRFSDDSTNRKAWISANGEDWLEYYSVGRTDFITPDEIGFVMSTENSATPDFAPIVRLVHWVES